MKIVVTGASGYVGRHLVPLLADRGADLLLAGRDPDKLGEMFPGQAVCGYSELAEAAQGYTMLLHLAVLNTGSDASLEAFIKVNVEQMMEMAALAQSAGIETFVNASSIHALDPSNKAPYAISKKMAAKKLASFDGLNTVNLYLPYVYDPDFKTRFRFAAKLPKPLGRLAFQAATCLKSSVNVSRIADFMISLSGQGPTDLPQPLILSEGQSGNPVFQITKRTIDLGFAICILVLLWWLLIAIFVLIRLDSKGPGLFLQERVGKDGKVFSCYKFRTMKTGTAHVGTHEVSTSAITRQGQWLRKSKLDELPQIINIFRNEMSLVGPRPCLPSQSELIAERDQRGVLAVKPGITGLAQVNGVDMRFPAKLAQWDARYLALQSLLLDLRILLATAFRRG
ncbi:Sugar transferase involved in lipopolysaccharide synthesis [Hoeflea phototrophica DFL-43]|jgi:lipopolysaccharide/colanic/teichoic acid biosynthesis glycosyltransferase/NAD(P)-dependent dehydrogenase (short-subunit alcohol dehydrogenase family)|uniref:Sugar transferase involved in lipopolysaccharide synthesis n=1 Tax=Hoeflea phototrophica (strain DSM 17068 / NCIMB 14078 / DFL-43) TaxID=411684 RepID=A9CW75_HOEPD|nr:sugar transferase [Hoeflea phototrophica]EDQ35476.2 Sugar transferase involved in lipopolysaccharide synthesis [Hoeflea phototrophica DFL-43]